MQGIDTIFIIIVLIMSVVIHEVSHGFIALRFGDKTALYAGRLTLNPLKHLDFFGSIIVPTLMALIPGGLIFGWAKPVPYNPNNLTNKKWGTVSVASAGILANIFLAIFFGIILRFSLDNTLFSNFNRIISLIVLINLELAIFNLIPIPPLDGSKILFSLLPKSSYKIIAFLEQYSIILILILLFFFIDSLYPILSYLFYLITGTGLMF